MSEGISRILLVTDERFTEGYIIFERYHFKKTRTKFSYFRSKMSVMWIKKRMNEKNDSPDKYYLFEHQDKKQSQEEHYWITWNRYVKTITYFIK
jgi:hypothetical protein